MAPRYLWLSLELSLATEEQLWELRHKVCRGPTSSVAFWLCCDSPSNAHSISFSLFSEGNEIKQSSLLGVGSLWPEDQLNVLIFFFTISHRPWRGHKLKTHPTPTHVLHSRKTNTGGNPCPRHSPCLRTTAVSLGTLVKSYLTQLVTVFLNSL